MTDTTVERIVRVYKITHIATGRIYIGITVNSIRVRWQAHIRHGLNGRLATPLHATIKSDGPDAFVLEEIAQAPTRREASELEKQFIALFSCVSPAGFNRTHGGDPHHRWSDEAKAKASASRTGKTWTPEVRAKLAVIMQTAEYRAKMRAASLKGQAGRKPITEETREKIRAAAVAQFSSPEARASDSARATARLADPSVRENLRRKATENWNDPDYQRRSLDALAEAMRKPEVLQKIGAATAKRMADPEKRKAISDKIKAKFQDPEYRARYDASRNSPALLAQREKMREMNRIHGRMVAYDKEEDK